jgi:hypothetical protein
MQRVVIVGGGAAGFFAAITCAEAKSNADVTILEKSAQFLSKVRISGGGRCNVTHACFDARDFATRFPRGEQPLIGPLKRFQAKDAVAWFAARGVKLKTESDGRMFPVTDLSETIIDCLVESAKTAGVKLVTNCGVQRLSKRAEGGFDVALSTGKTDESDRVLLATGGCRTAASGQLAVSLGHTLEPPVPSLFTFHIATPWLHKLAGISVESAEVSIPGAGLRERGPVLVTHTGLSGPAILRLSAWGARELHDRNYQFLLHVNWLPHLDAEEIASELDARREQQPAKLVVNTPIAPLPARLWEQLILASGIVEDARWSRLTRAAQHRLIQQLTRTELAVTGKSLNKEVDFKTMESRVCPGLYFAGELLDIDGITGGFNFQAAWTTGWIAGQAMGTIRP